MCVSSESPYSIGARTKLRFSLHRNAARHMLYVEAELVSKEDRILCSRLRLRFAQRRLSFFILIRLWQKQSKDPKTWVPASGWTKKIQSVHWKLLQVHLMVKVAPSTNTTRLVGTFVPHLLWSCFRCWCFLLQANQKCMLMHKRQTSRFFKGRYGLTLTRWYLSLVLTTHIHAHTG